MTKQDIEEHFSSHGSGKITEIKLMNGFGFIEYEDSMDARDVVPGKLVSSKHFAPEMANMTGLQLFVCTRSILTRIFL